MTALLEAENLSKHFTLGGRFSPGGPQLLRAVDRVSLTVHRGETLGLVGESGCGKSTLGRCLVRLYDVSGGTVRFEGRDITRLGTGALRPLRPRMQMVFQDPSSSLNPRRRVADLVAEPLRVHPGADGKARSRGEIRDRLHDLMDLVGLSREHLERYPHEFSGGQRQRIGIARALALEPSLIVADESVSALDVSVQAQIINLFMDLQDRLGITYLFIAHDLSVVRQISTRTAVMYLGSVVETGATETLFARPGSSLHGGAALRGPGGACGRGAAATHRAQGRRAEPAAAALRLPLPYPLPQGAGPLPCRAAVVARPRTTAGSRPAIIPTTDAVRRRRTHRHRPQRQAAS